MTNLSRRELLIGDTALFAALHPLQGVFKVCKPGTY